jgi:hypothetical protein
MNWYRYRNSVGEDEVDALEPLLQQDGSISTTDEELSNGCLIGIYLSHFLFSWNLRCYEFAAVSIFPGWELYLC